MPRHYADAVTLDRPPEGAPAWLRIMEPFPISDAAIEALVAELSARNVVAVVQRARQNDGGQSFECALWLDPDGRFVTTTGERLSVQDLGFWLRFAGVSTEIIPMGPGHHSDECGESDLALAAPWFDWWEDEWDDWDIEWPHEVKGRAVTIRATPVDDVQRALAGALSAVDDPLFVPGLALPVFVSTSRVTAGMLVDPDSPSVAVFDNGIKAMVMMSYDGPEPYGYGESGAVLLSSSDEDETVAEATVVPRAAALTATGAERIVPDDDPAVAAVVRALRAALDRPRAVRHARLFARVGDFLRAVDPELPDDDAARDEIARRADRLTELFARPRADDTVASVVHLLGLPREVVGILDGTVDVVAEREGVTAQPGEVTASSGQVTAQAENVREQLRAIRPVRVYDAEHWRALSFLGVRPGSKVSMLQHYLSTDDVMTTVAPLVFCAVTWALPWWFSEVLIQVVTVIGALLGVFVVRLAWAAWLPARLATEWRDAVDAATTGVPFRQRWSTLERVRWGAAMSGAALAVAYLGPAVGRIVDGGPFPGGWLVGGFVVLLWVVLDVRGARRVRRASVTVAVPSTDA